ncbi:MAG: ABC transporter permease [Oscillospiraceae bacterium]
MEKNKKSFFYSKLALTNIRKNSKTYIPYLIASSFIIMMYYIIVSLSLDEGLMALPGNSILAIFLNFGGWIIGIFAVLFLFYTNSFLIKRRKKEFGLFNILGMEKKHISRIMTYETIYTFIISIVVGVGFGLLFSKVSYLLLTKLLHLNVVMGFNFSLQAFLSSLILFSAIFFLILLNTFRQIHLSKPIELLKGTQAGEKEPKTKLLLTILGLLLLGGGYTIALIVKSPIDAVPLFFLAVILVIVGTFAIFIAGSIAILKLLRKNKKYYYKTKHFTTISGMIYRMKQNAAGLASICILSTFVLVILSTTVSLYVGMDDIVRERFCRNIITQSQPCDAVTAEQYEKRIEKVLEQTKIEVDRSSIIKYRSTAINGYKNENNIIMDSENFPSNMYNVVIIELLTLDEYNSIKQTTQKLKDDEVIIFSPTKKFEYDEIGLDSKMFKVKEQLDSLNVPANFIANLVEGYFIIAKDESVVKEILNNAKAEYNGFNSYFAFDSPSEAQLQIETYKALKNEFKKEEYSDNNIQSSYEAKDSFYSLYGGFLFLGIFLGLIFMMATVLIIYYKQISEGYDDKERFKIMQQVGMSHSEVKKAIHSQVITVFFLPLVFAGIHVAFSFNMISLILKALNLTNVSLFLLCTIGTILIFAICYAIVYFITAKAYYKIVSAKN